MDATQQNVAEILASSVLKTRFEDLDADSIEWAKTRIMDGIGCVVAGSCGDGYADLVEVVKRWGGRPEATVFVYGIKAPLINSVMVNAIMARSLDFGAVHPVIKKKGIPGHISETTVPTALTVAEAVGASGREMIVSMIAGEDLACRILAASGFGLDQGWDFIGTVNTFGATAIVGRLSGLTEEQLKNAFGIAVNQLGGTLQNIWDSANSFKLVQGLSARNGVFSAELARAGWKGCNDPLLSKYGYFTLYTSGCTDRDVLTAELGKTLYTDSSIKPYPCCRAIHGAIDSVIRIMEKQTIALQQAKKIEILLPPGGLNTFVAQPFIPEGATQADGLFSLRYVVANVLVRKGMKPEHLTRAAIQDPEVGALAKSIVIEESPEISPLGGAVSIELYNGKRICESTDVPQGDRFGNPLSVEEIEAKFEHNLQGRVTEKNRTVLREMLRNLEDIEDVKGLISLLGQTNNKPG